MLINEKARQLREKKSTKMAHTQTKTLTHLYRVVFHLCSHFLDFGLLLEGWKLYKRGKKRIEKQRTG